MQDIPRRPMCSRGPTSILMHSGDVDRFSPKPKTRNILLCDSSGKSKDKVWRVLLLRRRMFHKRGANLRTSKGGKEGTQMKEIETILKDMKRLKMGTNKKSTSQLEPKK
ncbi:hypothetical protein M9H77_17167 [Catharanthus roseus]|uniref:Uncharacterized protein n=1 Tax=Catharanthus roseus TaxID=4058 RepID=A0ACC0B3V7_CATRO|nr:hypothetical protein M9H77_17167 [Catharanthus roseus]